MIMVKRKKVVLFCEYFGNGGIEKVISYINKNIDKSKFDVKIVSIIKNTQIYNDEVESISKYKFRNPIYRFLKIIFNVRKIAQDADVIHFNIHSSIGLCYIALFKKSKAKIIVHAHNSNFDNNIIKLKSIIASIIKKLCYKKDYKYIACSENAGNFCFGPNVSYTILENKINYNEFLYDENKRAFIRKKYNIKSDEIIIGNIGRFQKQKNHKFLIDIFAEYLKINSNSKMILIGYGKEEKNILKQIKKRGIAEKIIIIDYCTNIDEMYHLFDFYLVPSKYEGYGITIFEALTSSLVCLVSDNVAENFKGEENLFSISLNNTSREWAMQLNSQVGYERKRKSSDLKNYYIENIEKIYED